MNKEITKSQIKRLRDDGNTYSEIGEELGVSRQRIHQVLPYYKRGRILLSSGKLKNEGTPYQMFGKKYFDLSSKERKIYNNLRIKEWRKKTRKAPIIYKRKCKLCGKEFTVQGLGAHNQIFCSRECFKENLKERQKIKYRELKLEVLIHYSKGRPRCACCGETIIEFLSIDHIEPSSNHTKWKDRRGGLYGRLKREGFPKGYQVLCFNCNFGKRTYKNCPHKWGKYN